MKSELINPTQNLDRKPRFSQQREAIKNIIHDGPGHMRVEEVYSQARMSMPKISLGTVYRNLKQLEDLGEVSQTQGKDQVTYYEPFSDPHHHFICNTCGLIEDLDSPTVKTCLGCISGKIPQKIENVVTTLYGKCERCQ